MSVQTYSVLTAEQKTFYDRTLLERLMPNLVHAQVVSEISRSIPKREGDTVNFRRFGALATATTPLTEGVTPTGSSLSITTVTATVNQYGDYIFHSDKLDLAGIDPVVTETSELQGEQAGETIDELIRDVVIAGTTIRYASTATARNGVTAAMVMNSTEIRKCVRDLKRAKVRPFSSGYYLAIVHPDAIFDLQADSTWIAASQYSDPENIYKGEIGRMWGVRFIESTQAKRYDGAGSGGVNVFGALFVGKGYAGKVDIAGSAKPEVIVKPLGSAGSADPLDQRASQGWKVLFATVRLNESCAVRLEHGATA